MPLTSVVLIGILAVSCPSQQEIDRALGKASSFLQQAQYGDAAEVLGPFSNAKCDPRIYLLLAASLEAVGSTAKAEESLQRARSFWPANTSIATSLARDYLNAGQIDKALQA